MMPILGREIDRTVNEGECSYSRPQVSMNHTSPTRHSINPYNAKTAHLTKSQHDHGGDLLRWCYSCNNAIYLPNHEHDNCCCHQHVTILVTHIEHCVRRTEPLGSHMAPITRVSVFSLK